MDRVILDLDGVVFEPISDLVIRASIKKFGILPSALMLFMYQNGIRRDAILKKINPVIKECRENAQFLPGALDALEFLTTSGNYRVDVCSTMPFQDDANMLEKYYRGRAESMNRIVEYKLLNGTQDKANYYMTQRGAVTGKTYVVDDSMHNIRGAYMTNAWPIYISTDSKMIKRANFKYGAMNFPSLGDFCNYLRSKQRG